MATADSPRAQGHTIVGGRPAGARTTGAGIPRGLEALMMKAAVDPAFLERLVTERAGLADAIGLALDPAERDMLELVPAGQLREMARLTPVPEPQRRLLAGGSAAALVALVTQLTFAPVAGRAEPPPDGMQTIQDLSPQEAGPLAVDPDAGPTAEGGRPDSPHAMPPGGARPDLPDEDLMTRGIRPDLPDEIRITRGIRPDLPPSSPPPAPPPASTEAPATPVATTPLTTETLHELIVHTNSAGLSFEAAINALRNETGIGITVQPCPGLDVNRPVARSVAGLPLGKAIRALCAEVAGDGALYEIDLGDRALAIRFKQLGAPPREPLQRLFDSFQPTRGSRPDVPRRRED
ncbi:MAG: hypothetical protein OZSIB_3614 [Candidatus Ozemobacter sibiricus]|uniref:Uncharacterized protein n=1 Tax=Candidatus Ozemobacter sibiricus TaxID=2268124 RepID=A0A367ZPZ7_9BACT|nr:MAG: hypothetical protein OZSIB_3614 [Candidatus Ozemobacter sibiricus]